MPEGGGGKALITVVVAFRVVPERTDLPPDLHYASADTAPATQQQIAVSAISRPRPGKQRGCTHLVSATASIGTHSEAAGEIFPRDLSDEPLRVFGGALPLEVLGAAAPNSVKSGSCTRAGGSSLGPPSSTTHCTRYVFLI